MKTGLVASRSNPSIQLPPLKLIRESRSPVSTKSANSRFSLETKYLRPEGPYITFDMIRKMREKVRARQESKKKWLTPRGFSTSVRSLERFIPNYVQASPSESPKSHSYREANRGKWLSGPFVPAPYQSKPIDR